METEIKTVVCPANGMPEVRIVSNTLEAFQCVVGGLIETVTVSTGYGNVVMIVNEEGVLNHLPGNNSCPVGGGFVGDLLFCGSDGDEFASLTDDQVRLLLRAASERYLKKGANK